MGECDGNRQEHRCRGIQVEVLTDRELLEITIREREEPDALTAAEMGLAGQESPGASLGSAAPPGWCSGGCRR